MMRTRRGFVLLAVLWVMVGISTVGLGLALVARRAATAAYNRRAMLVAQWAAEDCLSQSEEIIGDVLKRAAQVPQDTAIWEMLDRFAPNAAPNGLFLADTDCAVGLRAAGTTIDVNTADKTTLTRVLDAAGASALRADSIADAILDWRDPDQVARPNGAEANWYIAYGRIPPRDAPIADPRELTLVRGLERDPGLDSLFGVDSDRIVLDRAPLAVIAALPGLDDEALGRIAQLRARGAVMGGLMALSGSLSPNARDALIASYPELARRTTAEPDAWIVTSRGWAGVPRVTVDIQVRLARAGTRAAIVRRRTWVE
ncbi:MAG: general secretion pathway protein GspK [Gemmatimonadaceae bacterium]